MAVKLLQKAATARGRGVAVRYGGGIPSDEGETDTVRALVGQSRFPWACRILPAPARKASKALRPLLAYKFALAAATQPTVGSFAGRVSSRRVGAAQHEAVVSLHLARLWPA